MLGRLHARWAAVSRAAASTLGEVRQAVLRGTAIEDIDATSTAVTHLSLVPEHGHTTYTLWNGRERVCTLALLEDVLPLCGRVHLHTCWAGLGLSQFAADLCNSRKLISGLQGRASCTFTLSGFVRDISGALEDRTLADTYLEHGLPSSPKAREAHAGCCLRSSLVRIVNIYWDGHLLTVTNDFSI